MPRPSKNLDVAMLQAGRELFPQAGCSGLSVRAVAEQAGANLGMFHYHFKTKENFLRTLLQQVYEEMFDGLTHAIAHEGPALERLREALVEVAIRVPAFQQQFDRQVMSDEAIAQRVDLVIDMLRSPPEPAPRTRRRASSS